MPILIGGLFKGDQSRHVVEKLCDSLYEQVNADSAVTVIDRPGFKMMAAFENYDSSQELIVPLENNSALLIGRFFSKDFQNCDPRNLDLQAIRDSQGKYLGENYWGRYILICSYQDSVCIYRDPQGLSTLFYAPLEDGGYIFASSISLLYDVLDKKPDLNWKYLTSFVASNHAISVVTPFLQVHEAIPGCSVTLNINRVPLVSQFWDPTNFTGYFKEDNITFQDHLYDTIRRSTKVWTEGCNHVKSELSGGLDSSSLLGIMKRDNPNRKMSAYNMYHSSIASSDEREFARAVAHMYNVPLDLFDINMKLPFDENCVDTRLDRPGAGKVSSVLPAQLELSPDEERISGQGGDHLFLSGAPIEMILDYYYDKGFTGILQKIRDIAAFHRMPFLQILQKTMKLYLQHKEGSLKFLELARGKHPWMKDTFNDSIDITMFKPHFWASLQSLPPGKAYQIISILSSTLYIDHGQSSKRKNIIYPLLSQPVVELALSIPTYNTLAHGYDRFLYREAMHRNLKGEFMWRKSKGEASAAVVLGLRKNFKKVSELLYEGQFVKKGYIDLVQLEYSLVQLKHGNIGTLWPLLNLYVAEQWLKSWNL